MTGASKRRSKTPVSVIEDRGTRFEGRRAILIVWLKGALVVITRTSGWLLERSTGGLSVPPTAGERHRSKKEDYNKNENMRAYETRRLVMPGARVT